jgi:protease I
MKREKFIFPIFLLIFVFFGTSVYAVNTDKELEGKRVAFLITEGFHDGETMFPLGFLQNQGAVITVIGIQPGVYTAYNSDVTAVVEKSVTDVSVADFDALIIPGGHSPANLRENGSVVDFVREFIEANKPVASICHGPQVVIATGIVGGRTLTAVGGVKDEITEAGAIFVDKEVMIDGNLITSRTPPDLPAFSIAVMQALK